VTTRKVKTEGEIRDHLAAHLELIELGLTLIDKEVMLPNDKGARGFLDIFCRTANGKFLIIEVKRSDAAARDGIQELVKYAALLKGKLLVKHAEVRLMVASSEWHELLVPFSEFVRVAPYDCQGLRLTLGSDGLTASTEAIELAPAEGERRLSRRHALWGYPDEAKACVAVATIAAHMQNVGLRDFVLILLAIRGHDDPATRWVYFAQQELSLDRYMTLIRARFSAETVSDFEEWIDEMSAPEDKVGEAADKVWEERSASESLYLRTQSIDVQIAHPEKARMWFAPGTLISSQVFRFGRFEDQAISDETILTEILGEDGASFHHGEITASLSSKPEMAALLAVANNLLDLNPVWRTAVYDICAYAQQTKAASVRLRIFSNEDILRTVAGITIGYPAYAPALEIQIQRDGAVEQVFGTIEWNGHRPSFGHILKEYFADDSFGYFMLRHMSGQRAINADLMSELGLSYSIARLTTDGPIPIRVRTTSIDDIRGRNGRFLAEFPNSNPDFVGELVALFLKHEQEFTQIYDGQALLFTESGLEQLKDSPPGGEPLYWSGPIEQCEVCHRDMSLARFMIDSAVVAGGPWACMCPVCFRDAGGHIGWGFGQLYERDEIGWRRVGGQRPRDEPAEDY